MIKARYRARRSIDYNTDNLLFQYEALKNGSKNQFYYLTGSFDGFNELTIERKNVDGNYEPGNCEWITWEMQASNKRKRTSIPNRDVKTGRFVKSA